MKRIAMCVFGAALAAACSNSGGGKFQVNPQLFVAQVTNPLFPLAPGTKYVFEGDTEDGFVRIEVEVTAQRKEILGVSCIVVHAVEYVDGEVVEDTFDWFAQDVDGNVWYFGEDSKEIEDGTVVSTEGSWEAGVDGAQPGIVMLGIPTVGTTYQQELSPGVAEDMATVVGLDATVMTPLGTFEGCLETEDFTPLEPGITESKFYAAGYGTVLEVEPDGSRIELLSIEYDPPFNPLDFSTAGAHPLLPLVPGTVYRYEKDLGTEVEEIEVEVTTDTKVILGVTCIVLHDVVSVDGDVVEDTLDWVAVDRFGNVWYFGEDSKEIEDGMVVSTEGSWEAGVNGALPGILMFAAPLAGVTYRQELAPGVAEDMATVVSLDESVMVPHGDFAGCLETEDFTPLEPGVSEWKYYAPGVGLVLEVDEDGNRTELVEVE
jgi:hypothetical protein